MKISPGLLVLTALYLALPFAASADSNIDFACEAKRVDQKNSTSAKGAINVATEDWQYVVTLENKTFSDLSGVEIRYIQFFKQEQLGSTAAARLGRKSGSVKIDVIKGHDKVEFKTDPVQLTKENLNGARYYPNGAKADAEASLAGLWVRVYQNGNLIGEMARPANLSTKEKWEE